MSYANYNKGTIHNDDGTVKSYVGSMVCDSVSDMQEIPCNKLALGTRCRVVQDGETYILGSDTVWYSQKTPGTSYPGYVAPEPGPGPGPGPGPDPGEPITYNTGNMSGLIPPNLSKDLFSYEHDGVQIASMSITTDQIESGEGVVYSGYLRHYAGDEEETKQIQIMTADGSDMHHFTNDGSSSAIGVYVYGLQLGWGAQADIYSENDELLGVEYDTNGLVSLESYEGWSYFKLTVSGTVNTDTGVDVDVYHTDMAGVNEGALSVSAVNDTTGVTATTEFEHNESYTTKNMELINAAHDVIRINGQFTNDSSAAVIMRVSDIGLILTPA